MRKKDFGWRDFNCGTGLRSSIAYQNNYKPNVE